MASGAACRLPGVSLTVCCSRQLKTESDGLGRRGDGVWLRGNFITALDTQFKWQMIETNQMCVSFEIPDLVCKQTEKVKGAWEHT
jgi:hypothetical protein